jgi:hypothetical protein
VFDVLPFGKNLHYFLLALFKFLNSIAVGKPFRTPRPNRFTGGSRFPPAAPLVPHAFRTLPPLVQRFVWGFLTLLSDKKGCKGPPCSQVMRIPQENRKLINHLIIPKSALSVQLEVAKAGWPAICYLVYYI